MPRDATLAARLTGDFRSNFYELPFRRFLTTCHRPSLMIELRLAASVIQTSVSLPWESQCTIPVTLRVGDLAIA